MPVVKTVRLEEEGASESNELESEETVVSEVPPEMETRTML